MLDRINLATHPSSIKFGAQDCSSELLGSRTGDVSVAMLKEVGCSYVILGHSERRIFHHETLSLIKKKLELVQGFGLKTILCIGETEEDRMNGVTLETIKEQLLNLIPDDTRSPDNIIIAYEPLWAIGTGIIPSVKEINEIA